MTQKTKLSIALIAVVLGVVILTTPADAHEGESVITIEQAEPTPGGVDVIARVTWENDGHAAVDATVTAVGFRPDGSALPPVTMDPVDTDGRYRATLALPDDGPWTVRVTTIAPTGSLEADLPAPGPPPTAPPTAAPTTPSTAAATTTTSPDTDEAPAAAAPEDDDGVPWLAIVIPVAIIAAAAAIAIAAGRRRDRDEAD